MNSNIQIMEGSPGLAAQDVAHLMIPGRYRTPDGMGLHVFSERRVDTAAQFYAEYNLAAKEGVIVCSGYKNPGDQTAEPWHDERGIEYQGVPEAYGMQNRLVTVHGIAAASICADVLSIDSVTNCTNSQEHFPDDRPVGIAAQEQQLERILKWIAPHTMRREYLGIVVPEIPDNIDHDGFAATCVSRYITRGLRPHTPNSAGIAMDRAERVWNIVLGLKSLAGSSFVGRIVTGHSTPN